MTRKSTVGTLLKHAFEAQQLAANVLGAVAITLLMGISVVSAAEPQTDDLSSEEIADIEARIQQQILESNGSQISLEKEGPLAELLTTEQPSWIAHPSDQALVDHQRSVSSDLYFSTQETQKDLDREMQQAVTHYINAYLDDEKAAMLVGVNANYIRDNLVKEKFDEVWEVKEFNKSMYRRHALLEFNDGFRARLDRKWNDVMQTSKLLTTGLGSFGLLGLIGIAFAYLRLDSVTKGYYTGRLQFLAAVAILALAAAGTIFANVNADWLRWM